MTNHFNEISKYLDKLGRRRNLSEVFNDFLTLAICSYHRTNIQSRLRDKDEQNEELYFKTIKRYDKAELEIFPKILGQLQMQVYHNPYSDILGEYFTLNITNGHNGQYFTPEPVCKLMTKIQGDDTIEEKSVLDPTCGSGRMLLSFAEEHPNNFFYGADISSTCAKMSTVNFFLNGLRGEVAHMNTLSMEWFGGWQVNTKGIGIIPIEKEQSRIWTHPPKPKEDLPKEGTQLVLF